MAASRLIVDSPTSTLTSRSIFSAADVQEIKLSSDYEEFRQIRDRTV